MVSIYKITSSQTDKIYIGSTRESLSKRFCHHKSPDNLCSSHILMTFPDAKIELIEKCSEDDRRSREQYWIDFHKELCINQIRAEAKPQKQRSAEYRAANPEKVKESFKKWYDSHEEYNKEKNRLAWEKHKEDEEFREAGRQRSREWNEANKEKIKKYKQDNKDILNEKRRALINCPTCGKEISKASLSRHNKLLHK